MMNQPIPVYTQSDLERVLARDYAGAVDQAMAVLNGLNTSAWRIDPLRVRMACLKLGNGDLSRLAGAVATAQRDWRDALAFAEYSSYMDASGPEAQKRAIEQDWRELQAWLHRERTVTGRDEG